MTQSTPSRRRLAVGAALVTAAVLGGGAVAAGAATPTPSPAASPSASASSSASSSAEDADAAHRTAAEAERKAAKAAEKAERKAAKAAEQAERKADRAQQAPGRVAPTGPAFVCDPALNHGQNVSAYARSLPKGPGRGRLVSAAARSDCGKTLGD